MSNHLFYQLDVFANSPLAGNPLAVFPDAEGLSDQQMQALAREMNLSETTFVLPSERATRRVRFFTPTAEIPLAGHPTIGTWWLLAELGLPELPQSGDQRVTQETEAGVLPVDIFTERGKPVRVEMTQASPEFGESVEELETLAEMLGGAESIARETPRPQLVSTGLPQLMVPIAGVDRLESLPTGGAGANLAAYLKRLGTDCVMCFHVQRTDDQSSEVRARMFAPGLGVPEDPATGSAAGALGAYLVWHGLVLPHSGVANLVVLQGEEVGRPSRMMVQVNVGNGGEITEVKVGGEAVTIISGEVAL